MYSDSDDEDYGVSVAPAPAPAPAAAAGNVAAPTGGVSWERPWTLDEMRDRSTDWRLAGDAGVCLSCFTYISAPLPLSLSLLLLVGFFCSA
jgi:hypothetical protein